MHLSAGSPAERYTTFAAGTRGPSPNGAPGPMLFLLWLLAVILVVAGIFQLFKGEMLWGIVLIIIGFAVGPGGYSIFR